MSIPKRLMGLCVYCRRLEHQSVDHIIPRSKGGSNNYRNLVWACKPCNSSKGSKSLDEWRQKLLDRGDYAKVNNITWFLRSTQHNRNKRG